MKNKDEILPSDFQQFSKNVKVAAAGAKDYKKYFESDIMDIPKYAIGSYFWFIPDNSNMTIVDSSDNIHELTSFEKDEWKEYYPNFLQHVMIPEDFIYFLGGVEFMISYLENIEISQRQDYRFNIYARIKNTNYEYRWMVIQFPRIMYNKEGKALSSLIVVSDQSNFDIVNQPVMSLIDSSNIRKPIQRAFIERGTTRINCCNITKREREILSLMISGNTSPQIAEKLFISYHTVENHKRNLRQKTNCKTSAELIYCVLKSNLI